jgi:hypothetical protein
MLGGDGGCGIGRGSGIGCGGLMTTSTPWPKAAVVRRKNATAVEKAIRFMAKILCWSPPLRD